MSTSSLNLNPSTFDAINMHKIPLGDGQSLRVEPTAMLACRNVEVKTGKNGSLFSVASRYFFGGESLFQNTFTGKKDGGWIALEEEIPGQIGSYTLKPGTSLIMGRGAFVAADNDVKITTIYGGVTGWWKGLGFAKLKATLDQGGSGRVFFDTAKGQVKELKITEADGSVIVDNNNTVAHSGELTVTVRRMGNLTSMMFSGEGSVNEFRGNGSIFVGSGEKAQALNLFEQIITGFTNVLIPSKFALATLGGLYIVLNSDMAVRITELALRNFACGQKFNILS